MKTCLLVSVIFASFCLLPCAFGQGSLTPPGPPGATMLTLSQVEPRMPVDSVHTPGTTVAQFVISSPGSYYLTTNVVGVSGEDGIDIDANNVTLDLNGFSVIGVAGANIGIVVPTGGNVVVRNGIISGWTNGIVSVGNNVSMQELTVSSNGLYGIEIEGNNSSVTGNNVAGNNASDGTGYAGIYISTTATNTLVQNNHVVSTRGGTSAYGILAGGAGTIVIQNVVQGNSSDDIAWGSLSIVGQYIDTTSGNIVTNANPWGNFEF